MEFSHALSLLGLLAACAVTGYLIGRLIRERPSEVERRRPRIVASTAYLRDALNGNLSTHSRFKCCFDCVYLCCAEVAEVQGCHIEDLCHPTPEVIAIGLSAIKGSGEQLRTAELLAAWVIAASPELPAVPIKTACTLAKSIRRKTIVELS
ncbi:hypothetical protein LJ655_08915 [Paraburkholderia sp. MMS20-SJTN17]|uniref:Uncharacterized protein n=1 Tax=Paraburkholderia translucens TaxID=2886945 RepID=A0ABS8KC68_9BURK|nr:hypothetical protein [Paraburkholderia sp. MMS20-SJTN17]MCC8402012.1 hypothetical protein [Paraburkholderia sp. MMS20-SJTN17]